MCLDTDVDCAYAGVKLEMKGYSYYACIPYERCFTTLSLFSHKGHGCMSFCLIVQNSTLVSRVSVSVVCDFVSMFDVFLLFVSYGVVYCLPLFMFLIYGFDSVFLLTVTAAADIDILSFRSIIISHTRRVPL